MELLQLKLCDLGVTDFQLTADDIIPSDIIRIKTLIWALSLVQSSSDHEQNLLTFSSDSYDYCPSNANIVCIATALRSEDFVNECQLLRIVRSKIDVFRDITCRGTQDCDVKLSIARKDIAESITGYKSGTIPPICHRHPIHLFIDDKICRSEDMEEQFVTIGSGTPNISLQLLYNTLLNIAKSTCSVDVCHFSSDTKIRCGNVSVPIGAIIPEMKETPIVSSKSLSRRLLDAAGRRGGCSEVEKLVQDAGENFPRMLHLGSDGHFTKNALHLAAWKGDVTSVKLLIDSGELFGLDLVNTISIGCGNYGKTPIFYAITQDRDDVVQLLVERGANLLIVNNKGQTPCSLAVSHLQEETQHILFREESRQLEHGARFVNYRETDSDQRRYGDLDPRFPIDSDNWDVSVQQEVNNFQKLLSEYRMVNPTSTQEVHRVPEGIPRCVRQTTAQLRMIKAMENKVKTPILLEIIDSNTMSVSEKLPIPIRLNQSPTINDRALEKQNDHSKLYPEHTSLRSVKFGDVLTLHDIFCLEGSDTEAVCIIQDHQGVVKFSGEVENFLGSISLLNCCWGLDCEWKPNEGVEKHPVATLQLSTLTTAYILDLLCLCQGYITHDRAELTVVEVLLNETLSKLFSDARVHIVGFDIVTDLEKLAGSFPHLSCFRMFESTIDIRTVSSVVHPFTPCTSLSTAVQSFMRGKVLDKSCQCSDWTERPLSIEQIRYAALDAAVVLALFNAILQSSNKSALICHPEIRSSYRFEFMDQCLADERAIMPRNYFTVKVKKIMGLWFARTRWTTGHPYPPFATSLMIPRCSRTKRSTEKSNGHTRTRLRKNVLRPVLTLSCSFNLLPAAGEKVGYTKEECILRMHCDSNVSNEWKVGFNRRSGIVQLENAWVLFVNYREKSVDSKYKNIFLENGKFMTFYVSLKNSHDCRILHDLQLDQENGKKVFLFFRPNQKLMFYFSGPCICNRKSLVGEYVELLLELVEYKNLTNSVPEFLQIINKSKT